MYKMLVENGSDITIKNNAGQTPPEIFDSD
jgi:hypothetical protein